MEGVKKEIQCKKQGCNRRFRTKDALAQHKKDTHEQPFAKISAHDFTEMYDDLPDGAFFAMAGEMGLEHDDFV